MVGHENVLERLRTYDADESFYRAYYFAAQADIAQAFLEKNPPEDPAWLQHVLHPETIQADMTEEMFFSENRNVTVVKHPRYLPVFNHRHIFFEILYVVEGKCRQTFPDRTIELREGDCCLIAPGVRHSIAVFDDSVVLNVLIRRSTFLDIFLNAVRGGSRLSLFFLGSLYNRKKTRYLVYRTQADARLRGYILEMVQEIYDFDEYSDRIICNLLTIFCHQLNRRYGDTVETPDTQGTADAKGEEILNYIMVNYATVSIRSLAEHFHFAEPYCSKLVKDVSGSTFSELLTSIRMRRSENLLTHTQLSVEEISEQVGYKNPESFIRCFKRIYKVSPSQYRRAPEQVLI